ncbi:hypothetical protein NBRC10512v2_003352 [Rhodotorula toruloides]|uniref:Proteophosphoglycan ppg4 n=1 Tax=Rhodotorula toruloides (strain NP11) TaxID=1130832 RepID=M7WEE1_RHOT1|nr:uncharacterized protein RHTO_05702 [Rhodotorula toruloides NP11]EMS18772.1 hypothetical protein RHTO_05702 [Rhodotorula toruloides NP11]
MDTQTTGECMVWPGHRIFCGSNAFPIIFPLLSPVEAEEIIASFHVMDHPAASVTRLEILKARLGRPAKTESNLDTSTKMWQTLLVHSRFARYTSPTSLRDDLLGIMANIYWTFQPKGIFPADLPCELDKNAAETFHHLLCLNTLDALRAGRSVYPEADVYPSVTLADCEQCLATLLFHTKEKRREVFGTLAVVLGPLISLYEYEAKRPL